jgi:hypothetical protein
MKVLQMPTKLFMEKVNYLTEKLITHIEGMHEIEDIRLSEWTEEQKDAVILDGVDYFDYIVAKLLEYCVNTVENETGGKFAISYVFEYVDFQGMNDSVTDYFPIGIHETLKKTIIGCFIETRDLVGSCKDNGKVREAIERLHSMISIHFWKFFSRLFYKVV